ncbi:MAG: 50S ribosomal protein L24, partial [Phycisphaerales bacterium]
MPKHVRTGDQVMVTAGDNKGAVGEVTEVLTKSDQVIVKGVNMRTKHLRRTQMNPQGGTVTI